MEASADAAALKAVFAESESWKNYCEFKARRLKEKYFSDAAYWDDHDCAETVLVRYREPLHLRLRMDKTMARRLLEEATPSLSGRSFREEFLSALRQVRRQTGEKTPELLFLTGGVSRLDAVRAWCREVFPEAVVISGTEPEFSVSKGLAWCGQIDDRLRAFREDIDALKASDAVERIVRERIGELYRGAVDALVEPLLEEVALPVFARWRDGEIRALRDTDAVLQKEIASWLHTDRAMELLREPITNWLKPVSEALEEQTVPICLRHHVPYKALSLRSYLAASDIDIRLEAREIFAVGEITWLIDSIISLLVGLLCGGSGVALISSGPAGIVAGAAASLLVLVLGKSWMEKAILTADLPRPIRKMVPRSAFRARMDSLAREVRREMAETLEKDKNEALTARMADEISQQIERCLTKMAEVVEIPLG